MLEITRGNTTGENRQVKKHEQQLRGAAELAERKRPCKYLNDTLKVAKRRMESDEATSD
jgi:hypothetical protein